jgi:hypothetical protein
VKTLLKRLGHNQPVHYVGPTPFPAKTFMVVSLFGLLIFGGGAAYMIITLTL